MHRFLSYIKRISISFCTSQDKTYRSQDKFQLSETSDVPLISPKELVSKSLTLFTWLFVKERDNKR